MHRWEISQEFAKMRLDHFLVQAVPSWSRSAVQQAIKHGHVLVNDTVPTVHRFLKVGDVVTWKNTANEVPVSAHPLPTITILKETPDWIVLLKPAGLLVHPSHAHQTEPSLVDWLVAHYPPIGRVGEDPARPGIVHRLDKEVGGVMVVAKTQAGFDALKKQFAGRMVEKRYVALVHGTPPDQEGDIKLRIARSTSKARMAARPTNDPGGKAAWTHYRVRQAHEGATLLDLEILSGRTHQIRAHMHAIGCPIVGDALYAGKQVKRAIPAERMLLQSTHLAFNDPGTGERVSFDAPLDALFSDVTRTL